MPFLPWTVCLVALGAGCREIRRASTRAALNLGAEHFPLNKIQFSSSNGFNESLLISALQIDYYNTYYCTALLVFRPKKEDWNRIFVSGFDELWNILNAFNLKFIINKGVELLKTLYSCRPPRITSQFGPNNVTDLGHMWWTLDIR